MFQDNSIQMNYNSITALSTPRRSPLEAERFCNSCRHHTSNVAATVFAAWISAGMVLVGARVSHMKIL